MKKLLTLLLLAIIALPTLAFDDNDYQKFVKEVKEDVWKKDLPQFKNRTVPEQYKNESAVVLAAYDEMLLDQKSKLRMSGLNFYMRNFPST